MVLKWLNSIVYGRYNKLVTIHGVYNGSPVPQLAANDSSRLNMDVYGRYIDSFCGLLGFRNLPGQPQKLVNMIYGN